MKTFILKDTYIAQNQISFFSLFPPLRNQKLKRLFTILKFLIILCLQHKTVSLQFYMLPHLLVVMSQYFALMASGRIVDRSARNVSSHVRNRDSFVIIFIA